MLVPKYGLRAAAIERVNIAQRCVRSEPSPFSDHRPTPFCDGRPEPLRLPAPATVAVSQDGGGRVPAAVIHGGQVAPRVGEGVIQALVLASAPAY